MVGYFSFNNSGWSTWRTKKRDCRLVFIRRSCTHNLDDCWPFGTWIARGLILFQCSQRNKHLNHWQKRFCWTIFYGHQRRRGSALRLFWFSNVCVLLGTLKGMLALSIILVHIMIHPGWVYRGHGYVQHADPKWQGKHCFCYHIYFIPGDVELLYEIASLNVVRMYIVLDHYEKEAVDGQEKVVRLPNYCSTHIIQATVIPDKEKLGPWGHLQIEQVDLHWNCYWFLFSQQRAVI